MELDNFSKHCGSISQPWSIISNSNSMTVTYNSLPNSGFLAIWTATSEPPTYPTPSGCDSCTFPFSYGDTTFDTCVVDEESQPWCSMDLVPPTNEGSHFFPYLKISCSDSDSLCPSSTPPMLITSQNYPQQYPNFADEVREGFT